MFKRIISLAILLLLATCPAWAATAPQLDLGSTTVASGATTVTIPVTLTNVSGTTLGSVGTTIKFDTTVLGSPSIAVGPVATAAGKSASGSLDPADSSKFTIGIFGFNVTTIADGVVAYVTFNILNTGMTTLTNIITSDSGSNPNGDPVAMTGANGTITIPAPATYTVTYNGNGSTGGTAPTDTGVYQSGATVTVSGAGTLTKTGYTFAGWNTAANGSGTSRVAAATFSMGTANVTLYAQWTANNYTVTFNSNGGSAVSSQSIAYNTAATQPTVPTKTGSTFSGWYSDSALTTAFVFTTAITADSTLYAKWTTSNYTVTFNNNGGSAVASQSVTYNTVATQPTAPTKAGSTFSGWYSDSNLTTPFAFTTAITADTALYAKWTVNNYTVTFNSNGGGSVSSQSIAYNSTASQPTAPVKTGSTFAGWYSDSALTTPFAFTTAITADTALYAKWTVNNYTVTFNSNGGGSVSSQSVAYNSTASQPTAPVKTGSTFAGWYSDASLATPFAFTTAITANTALYAKWTVNNYTVTFNSNGGGSVSSQSVAYNSTASQPTAPVKTGLHFAGWYSDSALTTSFAFTTAITADTVLYAKWTANTVPAAPVNISAAAGNGQAAITFTEPSNNGGSAITGYIAISTPGGITATGTASPLTVTGLANGVEYTFTVAAINAIGTGAASISSNAVTPSHDDKTAPVLTLSMLSDGSATNNQTINISGNVKDLQSGLKTFVVNGEQATVAADGSFSVALTLAAGSNLITVVATDNANNETKETRTVVLDITVPTITISSPSDNIITKTVNIMTTGTVNESSVVKVRVNSESWQSATIENGNFNVQLFLASGLNTIEVSATDTAGNVATIKRTVRLDLDAPALAITEPAQDMTTGDKNITLAGSVSDAAGGVTVSISHAGQVFTPAVSNGTFTHQITFDSAKSYPVVVTATDEAGNVTTATRNFIYHPSDVSGADLNGDGSVSIADALKALHVSIGLTVATAEEISRGDVAPLVNGKPVPDGIIDIADAVVILERSVGLISW